MYLKGCKLIHYSQINDFTKRIHYIFCKSLCIFYRENSFNKNFCNVTAIVPILNQNYFKPSCVGFNCHKKRSKLFTDLKWRFPNFCCNVIIVRRYSSKKGEEYKFFKKEEIDLSKYPVERIRNFSIIAHVDHGKSTLADRLLEYTGTISCDDKNEQVLDKLQVERERGITVKAQTASLFYECDGEEYLLNLIDTPGHVDFNYEVSRSLNACQGVVLLVDANKGIQAQTVANFYLAFEKDLVIIPVLNKIDLKNINFDLVLRHLKQLFEFDPDEVLKVSAKFGTGIKELLEEIIKRIPPPKSNSNKPMKALLFDSWYNHYKGAICNIAIIDGCIHKKDQIVCLHSQKMYEVKDLGIMYPDEISTGVLYAGQVGYMVANMRDPKEALIGDTVCLQISQVEPLPGFKPAKPMVFAGIFPELQSQLPDLRSALEKLILNDSSVSVANDSSPALGQGWRLGFLGLLHMDVFQQRLEQEFNASVIVTAPNVPYKAKIIPSASNIKKFGAEEITIYNPILFPEKQFVREYLEPTVIGTIISPRKYQDDIIYLCLSRRGEQKELTFLDETSVLLKFLLPLNEIVVDFYDELKSMSSGFASFDYEDNGYKAADLEKLSFLLNGKEVEELVTIVHAEKARRVGRTICEKLKETIPQQLYEIAIQASIVGRIVARENVKALRKNVLAKCYGGDITRKMKLLKRQAEGKKLMRKFGNIELPKDTFIKVLRKK